MQVHFLPVSLPSFSNAIVTIGTFDGVHTGHRQIIQQLKKQAAATGGETVIITFHPHPRTVLGHASTGFMLNTIDEKLQLLEAHGIDHVIVVPFTIEFATQPAEDYILHFLWALIRPQIIIIGYDHHFGKNRLGNYKMLEDYGKQLGFVVQEIDEHVLNEVTISSTKIRQALQQGDIPLANEYLGYSYFFSGQVVMGNQLGRTIGYATANLQITNIEKLLPKQGVYAVIVKIGDCTQVYQGMMNIGYRPTVDGKKFTIEVHIFDFDAIIYEAILQVSVIKQLRNEQKFEGLNLLRNQLKTDEINARHVLSALA